MLFSEVKVNIKEPTERAESSFPCKTGNVFVCSGKITIFPIAASCFQFQGLSADI